MKEPMLHKPISKEKYELLVNEGIIPDEMLQESERDFVITLDEVDENGKPTGRSYHNEASANAAARSMDWPTQILLLVLGVGPIIGFLLLAPHAHLEGSIVAIIEFCLLLTAAPSFISCLSLGVLISMILDRVALSRLPSWHPEASDLFNGYTIIGAKVPLSEHEPKRRKLWRRMLGAVPVMMLCFIIYSYSVGAFF
ncbi:MAG: hypothetical protein LBU48_02380 [Coriobacteriales bacterium]|jgi:hypothetical protein|nr:hypothetical protein [Coriobacteriales bacterium]